MAKEKSKEVKLETSQEQEKKKLSYEDLEKLALQLNSVNKELHSKLQEAKNVIESINEVSLLLSILDKSEHFSENFTARCANKVETIITNALDNSEKREEATEG